MLFLTALEELRTSGRPDFAGVVYDSAPSAVISPVAGRAATDLRDALRAVPTKFRRTSRRPRGRATAQVAGPVVAALAGLSARETLSAIGNVLPAAAAALPHRKAHFDFFDAVRDPARNRPRKELVVYGAGDRLVPARAVEQFAALRRDQGSDVTAFDFGAASGHVAHFLNDPQRYKDLVADWA